MHGNRQSRLHRRRGLLSGLPAQHEALNRLLADNRSIPAARVQARRSVISADAPAVDGPPPTFQGANFDVDGVLVDSPRILGAGRRKPCSAATHAGSSRGCP